MGVWGRFKSQENLRNINILPFGTVFLCTIETLQMQTVRSHSKLIDTSLSGYNSPHSQIPDPSGQIKKLKISELKSWSVCFSIISILTGLLMYMRLGVTMENITSVLFFFALSGLIYSIYRIVKLSKDSAAPVSKPLPLDAKPLHELN
jgi:hypothetical protein